MRKALQSILVLVLALPPAWCCASPAPRPATDAAPVVQHSCCAPQSAPVSPDGDSSAPTPIATHCCCQKDWKPSPTVEPVEFVALPVELLTDLAVPLLASADAVAAEPIVNDPPLHILQCVWRC